MGSGAMECVATPKKTFFKFFFLIHFDLMFVEENNCVRANGALLNLPDEGEKDLISRRRLR